MMAKVIIVVIAPLIVSVRKFRSEPKANATVRAKRLEYTAPQMSNQMMTPVTNERGISTLSSC
jgi:hypothetical protein